MNNDESGKRRKQPWTAFPSAEGYRQQTAKQDWDLEFKCRELGLGRHQQVSKKVNRSSHSWGWKKHCASEKFPLGTIFLSYRGGEWIMKTEEKLLNNFWGLSPGFLSNFGTSVGKSILKLIKYWKARGKTWWVFSPLQLPPFCFTNPQVQRWAALSNSGPCDTAAQGPHWWNCCCPLACNSLGKFRLAPSAIPPDGGFGGSR